MKPHPTPPGLAQESVWDYPRPPLLGGSVRHIQLVFNRTIIAETRRAERVLETGHPPVYYIPPRISLWNTWCQPSTPRGASGKARRRITPSSSVTRRRQMQLDSTPNPLPPMSRSRITQHSIPKRWTAATWMGNWSCRSRVAFTAAGSPARL